jgi:hypothetical protein
MSLDSSKVVVARRVLYLQGVLLGVVGIGGFVLGILVGRSFPSGPIAVPPGPQACLLSGTVSYVRDEGATLSDAGAVAIVLPQANRPEGKSTLDGLRPKDPAPTASHPGLQAIRSLGGNYARADEAGRFRLRVPDTGKYYVLVISAHRAGRPASPPRHVLAELGRFFVLVPDLFAGADYRWREENVQGDCELNIVFP